MTTQIALRLDEKYIEFLDRCVREGKAVSRADYITQLLAVQVDAAATTAWLNSRKRISRQIPPEMVAAAVQEAKDEWEHDSE